MKLYSTIISSILALGIFTSCNDFLDRPPLSSVSPDKYFHSESDLANFSITLYSEFKTPIDWTMTTGEDNNTDNQAEVSPNNRFSPGEWRVAQNKENWDFTTIYKCNNFLDNVLANYQAGSIKGDENNIRHYIGEVYLIRAYNYFTRLKEYGDFPIVRNVLPDDMNTLTEASKRMPRNEVARFIISDLDSAAMFLSEVSPNQKVRLSKNVAYLLKSRVALYEGSWLKSFKGTSFVPKGEGWPGEAMYPDYQYPSGDIDSEINYFLDNAIASAKEVAEKVGLTSNSYNKTELNQAISNPYYRMFCDKDLESYEEVLFWRSYDQSLVSHVTTRYLYYGSCNSGYTRGFVQSFLMENGLPIYAENSGYKGDSDFTSFREDRDWRLSLFTKTKGDFLYPPTTTFEYPKILAINAERDVTGYSIRKYCSHDEFFTGANVDTGFPIFRSVEAYLNYIEAYYLRYGSLDVLADKYWKAIRTRAGIDPDYQKTIAATDMSKEAPNDWGAYTGGQLVDPTLYNIRRERRCEFIAEGLRYDDLRRWRSMDQMVKTPYIIEGFNLWTENYKAYVDNNGTSLLITSDDNAGTPNVSPKSVSNYLRPYQIVKENNRFYDGYKWHAAHYLSPIPMDNFIITSNGTGDVEQSTIYQNPGWPKIAQQGPSNVIGF